jgi:predicted transcriptional regulator
MWINVKMMFIMMNKRLLSVFHTLGLSSKHALIYTTLLAHTSATPLDLARESTLNRSSIYRYLVELQRAGLVEEILEAHSTRYQATSPENLQLIITQQEAKLESLKNTIPHLVAELTTRSSQPTGGTRVYYYQGVTGLRQMLWKMTKTGKDYVGLGYEDWNTSVGKAFAEKLRLAHIENKALSRELQNDGGNYDYTQYQKSYVTHYQNRVIDRKVLEIKHDTYIYGDVFAYFYHYKGELFGVEIHNTEIAKTEKQIFEILWKMGKEVK